MTLLFFTAFLRTVANFSAVANDFNCVIPVDLAKESFEVNKSIIGPAFGSIMFIFLKFASLFFWMFDNNTLLIADLSAIEIILFISLSGINPKISLTTAGFFKFSIARVAKVDASLLLAFSCVLLESFINSFIKFSIFGIGLSALNAAVDGDRLINSVFLRI